MCSCCGISVQYNILCKDSLDLGTTGKDVTRLSCVSFVHFIKTFSNLTVTFKSIWLMLPNQSFTSLHTLLLVGELGGALPSLSIGVVCREEDVILREKSF